MCMASLNNFICCLFHEHAVLLFIKTDTDCKERKCHCIHEL